MKELEVTFTTLELADLKWACIEAFSAENPDVHFVNDRKWKESKWKALFEKIDDILEEYYRDEYKQVFR